MSVDRGNMKLARKMAELIGPAKRALYTVAASPGLNRYVLSLSEMHFSLGMAKNWLCATFTGTNSYCHFCLV